MSESDTPKRVLLPISFFGTKEEPKTKIDTVYLKRGEGQKEKPVKTTGGKKKGKEPEPNEALDMLLAKEKPTKKDVIEYFKTLV